MDYAGGRTFPMPFGVLKSSNITFDENTGIGKWTKEDFIQRFKSNDPTKKQILYQSKKMSLIPLCPGQCM